MSETLYPYYERELIFIRQLSQEFARQYPAAAGRLLLEPGRSGDPHIERLIESFALLAGRIHHKLDDEFPELTDALLGVLYPHYLAPIPSMTIVQFVVDPDRAALPNGFLIDQGSKLRTQPVHEVPCQFRTGYPVTLWPLDLTDAGLLSPPFPAGLQPPPRTAAALRLTLECQAGMKFADLTLDRLRFYLAGDNQVVAGLYELLFNNAMQVVFRSPDPGAPKPIVLKPEQCLTQVGFEEDEDLLPCPRHSFAGYRLLTEFFTFPNKFLFVDLSGLERVCRAGFGSKMDVVVFLNRSQVYLEQGVDNHTFRLGCTPAVNLFEQVAEPIALSGARYEYRITPDVAHPLAMEVYSVDAVTSVDPETNTVTEYQPFYSFRHAQARQGEPRAFWYCTRQLSTRGGDKGTDVSLNLVDLNFDPKLPSEATLVVRTTCTNRGLPAQLQRAGEQLLLELEAAAPVARIRCLRSPTLPLRPPQGRGAHWRLVSHLTLNHLSLSDPVEARAALQEILTLYDFSDAEAGPQLAAVNQHLIDGVAGLSSRRIIGRTGTGAASGFARGVEVTLELDEQKFVGTGAFLFASVLERFLALYASINSFTQLVARTRQGERTFKKWPPRAGAHPML